jgi:hypothetical protein
MPKSSRPTRVPSLLAGAALATVLSLSATSQAQETPPAPSPQIQEDARVHFTAGVNLLQDPAKPRYDEAYAEFKKAYELVPSWKILGNIALCAMNLERDSEAIDAYTRYLAEAKDLDPAERAQAERDLSTLKAGLVKVTVSSNPDGAQIHDTRIPARGQPVTNIYGPIAGKTEIGVRRGHHVIKAHYPDGVDVSWEIDLDADQAHVFDKPIEQPKPVLPPVAPAEPLKTRPITTPVYIGAAATGALAVGWIVTGSIALSTHSKFENANDGSDPNRAKDLRSSGQTMNVVSDIFLGTAIVAGAVTAYLYLTRPTVTTNAASTLLTTGRITF